MVLESRVESNSVKHAKSFGCEAHKLRVRSAPDRLFVIPGKDTFFYVEFKKLGEEPDPHQKREHKRLRDKGFSVYVIDTFSDFKKTLQWELEI